MKDGTFKILKIIASLSVEGENLVVDKKELLEKAGENVTAEDLDADMEELDLNELISLRFNDPGSDFYMVAMRPKGKLLIEQAGRKEKDAEEVAAEDEEIQPVAVKPIDAFGFRKLAFICMGSSFFGGVLAAIIAFLIAKFG